MSPKKLIAILLTFGILAVAGWYLIYTPEGEEVVQTVGDYVFHYDMTTTPYIETINLTEQREARDDNATSWVVELTYNTMTHNITHMHYFIGNEGCIGVVPCSDFRQAGERYGMYIEDVYGYKYNSKVNATLYNSNEVYIDSTFKNTTMEKVKIYLSGDDTLTPRTIYQKMTVNNHISWLKVVLQ